MDDKIKQMFKIHVMCLNAKLDPKSKKLCTCAAYAMCELVMLYSEIMGISYDEAAEILHKEGE